MSVRGPDVFDQADAYERYVGRWSRRLVPEFVRWIDAPAHSRWLDVGCGTGSLTEAILTGAEPSAVVGIDRSAQFVEHATGRAHDPRATFRVGDAMALELDAGSFDVAASALVLNFVPDPAVAVSEMRRAVRAGGTVAACVWDYAGDMRMMRVFWDAAIDLDGAATANDEGSRFTITRKESLRACFERAGLEHVDVRPLDVEMRFSDFDDYWEPFLSGQAPAPAYAMSLPDEKRTELRELIRSRLEANPDGSIEMTSRAWAVKGSAPLA